MEQVTGDIVNVRAVPVGGYYTAEFEHKTGGSTRWFSAGQESDGTLRIAGILTALLQDQAPSVIGIEEPELTINPGLLPLLYDYIRAASEHTQIILTTHSPDFLDLIPIEQVRAVGRVDGVSSIGPVSPDQVEMVRKDLLSTGELLRTGGIRPEGDSVNYFDLFPDES
jgi:predicted ATPase